MNSFSKETLSSNFTLFFLLSVTFQVCAHHSLQMTCIQVHSSFQFSRAHTAKLIYLFTNTHTHTTAFCSFYISLIENKTSIVVLTGWEIIDGHRFNTLCFSSLVWNWWVWWFLPQSNISWYPVNMHKQQKLQPPFLSVCLQTLIPQGFPLNHSHAVSRSCCVTCYPIMTRENEASLRKEANMQWHVQVWETLRHRMGPVTANSTVELNA